MGIMSSKAGLTDPDVRVSLFLFLAFRQVGQGQSVTAKPASTWYRN